MEDREQKTSLGESTAGKTDESTSTQTTSCLGEQLDQQVDELLKHISRVSGFARESGRDDMYFACNRAWHQVFNARDDYEQKQKIARAKAKAKVKP